ncbi:hypothetical protein MSBR2_0338 [Methanosarcina barkeri 227]|uniref:Uncharacterized protein n=1 Tax=Methanosarcina barkeri 227 TaxID=1434106 RepID=A0A0E3R0M7_METBA|nr:hypothetical protein MSBR2_0338 [Methanosarcina barkeri 227]
MKNSRQLVDDGYWVKDQLYLHRTTDELPQLKKIRNLADWKDVKKTIKETKLETLGSTAQEAQLKTPEGAC